MRKILPQQFMEIFNRLDELEIRGSGFGGGGIGGGAGAPSEDRADVSPNLVANAGFENWTDALCDSWFSAAQSNWNTGAHYVQETTTVYSLPYAVKLGDGSNAGRGIAQESAFRVVPGEAYYLSVRLLGGDEDVEYIVILKAFESDGVTEITTGEPFGENWTYSASYGGWYITGVAGTEWGRVTAPITLAPDDLANDVCYLQASIQYYQNGAVKYLYADDFAITRGSQLPAFSYKYLTEQIEPDLHNLLSLTHPDTLEDDVLAGDIIYGNITPKWARLEKGADGEVLKLVSGLPSWEAEGGGTTHSILSATHTDSVPDVVTAGDLIYGNVTPAWTRLAKGTEAQILAMFDGYPTWKLHTPTGSGELNYLTKWTGVNTVGKGLLYDSGSSIRFFFAPSIEFVIESVASLPAWGNKGRFIFLLSDNTVYWDSGSGWVPASPLSTLLSDYHTDTLKLTGPLVAGDLIMANATPRWARFSPGAEGQILQIVDGKPAWSGVPVGEVSGSGTVNKLARWTVTGTILGDSILTQDLTNRSSNYPGVTLPAPVVGVQSAYGYWINGQGGLYKAGGMYLYTNDWLYLHGRDTTGIAFLPDFGGTVIASVSGTYPGLAIWGTTNVLEMGRGVAGKEANAGKIGYQTFSGDSLDIVGAGSSGANRKIKLWGEGGIHLACSRLTLGYSCNIVQTTNVDIAFRTWYDVDVLKLQRDDGIRDYPYAPRGFQLDGQSSHPGVPTRADITVYAYPPIVAGPGNPPKLYYEDLYGNITGPLGQGLAYPGGRGYLVTTNDSQIIWLSPNLAGSILMESGVAPPVAGWLSPGANGYVLTMVAGLPSWQPSPGGGGAPVNASYTVVNATDRPINSRVLVAGTGISFTDTGVGGNLTITNTGAGSGTVKGAGTPGHLPVWTLADTLGDSWLKQQPSSGYTVLTGYWNNTILIANATPIGWMRSDLVSPAYGGINYTSGNYLVLWNTEGNGILFATGSGGVTELARLDPSKLKLTNNQNLRLSTGASQAVESGFCSIYAKTTGLFYQIYGQAEVPLGGGIGPGTTNYLAKFTAPTTIGNSALRDDGTKVYTNTAIMVGSGTYPYWNVFDGALWRGRVIDWSGSDFWFGYMSRAGNFIIGNGAGAPKFTVDVSGNVWIAGKLTQAGCPAEWHRPNAPIEMFRAYLRRSVRKREHVTGEEVYALMRLVLELDRSFKKLRKAFERRLA
jgi:hypothetical protein